ncbi:MAG: potassium transporter [Steroidobacteraceae bacterium]|nr:potassium transporter [Steroidobacteraceae bacterium]
MFAVLHVLGLMLAFFAITFVLPLACSLITGDGLVGDYLAAAALNVLVGVVLAVAFRRFRRELAARDGFLLVTLAWVMMSAAASLPLMMAIPGLSFTDAYFEAMSGLTTTGSTVLSGLDLLPPSVNLWRHALHWYGGLGIIVLAVAVLPLLGVGGMQVYKAESPGPVKDEKLTPRITQTAKALWLVYTGITAAGIIALHAAGMDWFDAICHSFSAIGLGGFSTHDAGVGYFHSAAIEFVLMLIMLVACVNFSRHFMAVQKLSFAPYLRDTEAKAILIVLGTSIFGITMLVWVSGHYEGFATALRHVAFSVISVASTTGFVTQDYEQWPIFAPVWMLFLSCIVCSTGSTGGGIKMFRTLLLERHAVREMKVLLHPRALVPIRIGGQVIPDRIVYAVLAFIFLYFATIAVLTFVLLLSGLDLVSAFSGVVASVNNLGPGLELAGPSTQYQKFTDLQTWVFTIAMLVGRLEIFSVLVLFTPAFWRK